ncbi:hypothetical protein QAD02_024274 [Eretmocerus hayati]|uniref:Uncharacterized protein n=1 Tax=Eretmocerus hayati TaxID=131215 RepID=A0ACC2PY10_9HYME|nr:hypothetical protein QAD02_024274 [Eretmocerus hayati]
MSLSEKFAQIMERPGQDPSPKDDVPWYLKYAARSLGCVAGFFGIFLGVFNMITFFNGLSSLFAGVIQIVVGFVILLVEAPCCCLFIEFVQQFSNAVEQRPYWNKAAAYCIGAVLPILFGAFLLSTFFTAGLTFGTGALYGMMSIGKKAPMGEMMRNAGAGAQGVSSNMKSTLVENAVPIGVSTRPDSNV